MVHPSGRLSGERVSELHSSEIWSVALFATPTGINETPVNKPPAVVTTPRHPSPRNTHFRCPPMPPSSPSLNLARARAKSRLQARSYFGAGGADPTAAPTGSARGLSASPRRRPCTAAVAWPTARIDRPCPSIRAYHWDAPRDAYRWLAVRRPWLRGIRQ